MSLPINERESKSAAVIAQTLAIFLDAYRELNAKRLFWITLIISGLIVAGFGAVGINAQGFVVLWKEFPSTVFNTLTLDRPTVYKWMFAQLGVDWWLAVIAAMLALISTAGIFPEFLTGGAIDLYLSKPIGRLRLFLTKYLTGLIFVALQVLAFCIGSFFVIGLRGGVWEPAVFIAVPLVVLFFSYLFSVVVLLGVMTRSTIASLLLTILFWGGTFAFHSTEVLLLHLSVGKQFEAQMYDREISQDAQTIQHLTANGANLHAGDTTQPFTFQDRQLQLNQASLALAKQNRSEATDPFAAWHRLMYAIMYPLPKTSETVDLIKRVMGERMHLHRPEGAGEEDHSSDHDLFHNRDLMRRANMETNRELQARSKGYILGTSLAFESVLIILAACLFCRRDF